MSQRKRVCLRQGGYWWLWVARRGFLLKFSGFMGWKVHWAGGGCVGLIVGHWGHCVCRAKCQEEEPKKYKERVFENVGMSRRVGEKLSFWFKCLLGKSV
jgi:hypothetical protein